MIKKVIICSILVVLSSCGFTPMLKDFDSSNLSIQKVLKRGFAIVRDAKDKKIVKTSNVNKEHLINIEFYDGILTAKTQKK